MALRAGHGAGAGTPRIEVLPADELPDGVAAPLASAVAPQRGERRADGTFARGSRTAQSRGGLASRDTSRLAHRLGLAATPDADAFAPYRRAAATFRRVQCSELARTVGGGVCGPGPSSIVASAALALGAGGGGRRMSLWLALSRDGLRHSEPSHYSRNRAPLLVFLCSRVTNEESPVGRDAGSHGISQGGR